MKISVVIPTRNRARLLTRCLDSLVGQSRPPDEVVVVDNGSTDDTKSVVALYQKRLKIKYVFKKGNVPKVRNAGLSAAGGSVLCLIDDDCRADFHWLKEVEKVFRNDSCHQLVVMGKSLNGLPDNLFACLAYYFVERTLRNQLAGKRKMVGEYPLLNGFFDTKNVAFSRQVLEKLAYYFDEKLKIYVEDVDLGIRLRKSGADVIFNPKVRVKHYGDNNWRSFVRGRFRRGGAYYLLMKKWASELARVRRIKKVFQADFSNGPKDRQNKEKELRKEILKKKNFAFKLLFRAMLLVGIVIWKLGYYRSFLNNRARKFHLDY